MSAIIYFSLCVLLFSSTILSTPTPAIVYSAVIHNPQGSPLQCTIKWAGPGRTPLEKDLITVESNKYTVVPEKTVDMDGWTARKIIRVIRCGDLKLKAPFPKVNTIQTYWEFRVEPNEIVSVGPSSYVSDDEN